MTVDMDNLTVAQRQAKRAFGAKIEAVTEDFLGWVDRNRHGLSDEEVGVLLHYVAGDDMADAWEEYCAE